MEKLCADNTICFAKVDITNLILRTLNSFLSHIKFTIEIAKGSVIPSFNALVIKALNRVHTTE